MARRRVTVLSDLHLGPDGPLSTFREGKALAALIESLTAEWIPEHELILAGDIFDFLQTPDYEGFDVGKAPTRFASILAGGETLPVVAALRSFAARRENRITVLAGNHDPEMLLPPIRTAFERAIQAEVLWADDSPLLARTDKDWPVWGRAITTPAGDLWVVHGDRWDPINAIERDRVEDGMALPTGSQLVYKVLNKIQPDQRWIPELKPEAAVFGLLLYLAPERTLAFLEEHFGLGLNLLIGRVRAKHQLGDLFDGEVPGATPVTAEQTPSLKDELPLQLAQGLKEVFGDDLERATGELETWLSGSDAQMPRADDGHLASHSGIPQALLRVWLEGQRRRASTEDATQDDGMLAAARRFLPTSVVGVIAGHTHGPRAIEEGLRYLNTGTWIPVGVLHEGSIEEVIDDIEAQRWIAESPRTFVVVDIDGDDLDIYLAKGDANGKWTRCDDQ
jgi:UDP-2,3-diacylglucosamine pyrophosphatase LpxH